VRRIGAVLLTIAVPFACTPPPARAALPQNAWAAINAYAGELERVEKAKSRVSMERLFLLAVALERELITPTRAGVPAPMEGLSEQQYSSLQSRLRGILLNRDEVLLARPDLRFFIQLGERKGTPEDRLFFHLYRMTYPGSIAPAYTRQQTDYSGCTDYGSGKLTRLYGEWRKYGTRHPNRYESVVQEERSRIVRELVQGTCACGDQRSAESEFRYFLRRHPGSPIVPKIRARLDQLKHGTTKIRFKCMSG
jgi:hypothetical protein